MIENCKKYLVKGLKTHSKTINLFTVESNISKEIRNIQTKWKKDNASNLFNLSSVRSEGQFNTMIYDESDVFRKQKSRNVLYISAVDIEKLGLSNGSIVNVQSETGSLKEIKLAEYDIKPGNVMTYMPEANILIPQNNDERSKTPSFKSVSVTITNH